jgi:UDP:flavonoid glycosyltransferase YjiC (YdhE family)
MTKARNSRRILIVSWDGGGNAVPAYHLGRRLLRAGHDVHLLGWVDQARAATAAGLQFTAYPSVPPWPDDVAQDDRLEVLFGHLRGDVTRAEIAAVIEDLRPDALVIDGMMLAAYDAAGDSGLPTVVLCHLLASLFSGPWGEMVMGRPVADLFDGVDRVLALTDARFDEAGAHHAVTYVGPVTHPDVDRSPSALRAAGLSELLVPGDPWVLTSLSTTRQGQRDVLPGLLDQLAELPVRALLTLGGVVDPADIVAPANVLVHAFVPHEQVFPHMAAYVSHAGLSGISTALAYGVPLVCVPQGRDQGHNAARVVACGVGLSTEIGGVASGVLEVLGDPSYAEAAAAFTDSRAGEEATRLVQAVAAP